MKQNGRTSDSVNTLIVVVFKVSGYEKTNWAVEGLFP